MHTARLIEFRVFERKHSVSKRFDLFDEEWTERFDTLNFSTRISFNFSGVFNFEITEMKFLRNHSLDKYQSNFATVLFP